MAAARDSIRPVSLLVPASSSAMRETVAAILQEYEYISEV
jgi:hypothetical protein